MHVRAPEELAGLRAPGATPTTLPSTPLGCGTHMGLSTALRGAEFSVRFNISELGTNSTVGLYLMASGAMEEAVYVGVNSTAVFIDTRKVRANECIAHTLFEPCNQCSRGGPGGSRCIRSWPLCCCAAVLLTTARSVVHGMHMVASCAQSSQDMTKYQPSFRVVLDAPFPKPASGVVQLHVFLDETVVEASILWCLLDLGFRHITLCGSGWIRILTLSPLVVRLHNAGLCIGLRVPKHRCTQPGRMRLHNTQQSCAGHYGSGFPAPRQRDPIRIVRVMRGQ